MTMRATIASVAVVLGLAGCPSKDGGSGEPAASPPASAAAAEGGAASVDGEAKGDGGLAASVQQQVDAARGGPPATAAPPEVEAGAPLLAVVNGMPVPKSAFESIYGLKVEKYRSRGREIPDTADRRYRVSITMRLIHQERLRQAIAALGTDYDPADLGRRQEQQRKGIRDWAKHLERRGESEESLRAMVIAELREAVILESQSKLVVPRAEVEADYEKIRGNWTSDKERVRASHILISIGAPGEPVEAEAEAAAEAEAKRLYALATAPGADFAALAREHSTGPSATKGGDIGIFTADRMVPEFSDLAFATPPGSIAGPVKTKFGFHIIKVVGKWPPGELPLSALEDQIVDRLRARKLHQGRRELGEQLEAKYPATHHMLSAEELAFHAERRDKRDREAKSEAKREAK